MADAFIPPERPWYSAHAPELLTLLGAALAPLRLGTRRDPYGRRSGGFSPFAGLPALGSIIANRQGQEDTGNLNKFLSSIAEQQKSATVQPGIPQIDPSTIGQGEIPETPAPMRPPFGPLSVDYTSPPTQEEFQAQFKKLPASVAGSMPSGAYQQLLRSLPGRAKSPEEIQRVYETLGKRVPGGEIGATSSLLSKPGDLTENLASLVKLLQPERQVEQPGTTITETPLFGESTTRKVPESSQQQFAGAQLKDLQAKQGREEQFRKGMDLLNPESPDYLKQVNSLATRYNVDPPSAIKNALDMMNNEDAMRHRKALEGFESQRIGIDRARLGLEKQRVDKTGTGGLGISPGSKEADAALSKIRDDARQYVEGLFKVGGPVGSFIDFKKLDPDPEKARAKLETLIQATEERMIADAEKRGLKLRTPQQPSAPAGNPEHPVGLTPSAAPPSAATPTAQGQGSLFASNPAVVLETRAVLTRERPPAQFKGKRFKDPITGLEFESDGTKWELAK